MLNPNTPRQLLGGISPEQFLKEYWQKKPLLVRQAIPDYDCPISADELAGLSMEEMVESRIILENGRTSPWELKRGPFSDEDFQALPNTHWTLLIQQLDAWSPEINELKKLFQFIPNWRIDDIMASYAPYGGSVGPHFDYYDVFLLQAHGERHWRIGQECGAKSETLSGTPLSILREFDEQEGWILQPGDMLYLPPKLAHYGIAQSDCITLSVGFRAPKHEQLLSHFTDYLIEHMEEDRFYEDPDLRAPDHCGEINNATLNKVQDILASYLNDTSSLQRWFGSYLTEPKNEATLSREEDEYAVEDIEALLQENTTFHINEGSRLAYSCHTNGVDFYVDGRLYSASSDQLGIIQHLCKNNALEAETISRTVDIAQFKKLMVDLLNQGSLYFDQQ